MRQRVIGWQPINARMCKLRIKGRFFNYSIINVHCPHEGRPGDEKEAFYAQLEQVYDGCSQRDVKIVIGEMNAQVGREAMYRPAIGPNSLHAVSNDNGQRCVNFAASRGMVVRSTFFPRKDIHKATWRSPDQHTENQIDHVLIDGKFFSDIINVRTYRSANIDSDHYLVARWKQYYDEHLNGEAAENEGGTATDLGARAEDDRLPAPDLQEVEEEIGRLKDNKATGVDQLPSELLKYGGEALARALHWVIAKIWEEEILPEEWMEGVVCPIYKKGDKLDCCNYRAITLLSAAYKVLSQILCRRLSPYAREFVGQYQAGFMGARATTDQIFAIRQVLQKCREYNVPTHHLFIDFKSAYDTIDRDQLWQIMHEYGFPDKLTRLVKATMNRVMCVVRVSGTLSTHGATNTAMAMRE
ncbi:uncharacterized protein LOC135712357 [Ochlerotatus camptorhynchus]|uniref:uncharacterized protein LOC135712357 n=1 Tax=Ochlerotatus camptorhynchus TaxID=644619 RepID=UPI0031D41E47